LGLGAVVDEAKRAEAFAGDTWREAFGHSPVLRSAKWQGGVSPWRGKISP